MTQDKEEPIEEKYKSMMYEVATLINNIFNPDGIKTTGFALLVFPFEQPNNEHKANYLSNAIREDMLATMKEFIARAEGRYHDSR